MKSEISEQKKFKEKYIHDVKQKLSNPRTVVVSSNSESKFRGKEKKINSIYNNDNTFNKYKAAIMALKDYK